MIELLRESRAREKAQSLFYRELAARAEVAEDREAAERLNALHADEQHHFSRLTARLLEMGERLEDVARTEPEAPYPEWEAAARAREEREVEWYEGLLEREMDRETRRMLEEIVESERHHRDELGGKWMPA